MGKVSIDPSCIDQIIAAAAAAHPEECCGVLVGHHDQVTGVIAAENTHPSPTTHFAIDDRALIDAHRAARTGGPQVLGYYHSHPNGRAEPSAEDQRMASGDGSIWAIAARQPAGNYAVSFWQDDKGAFSPLPYDAGDG